MTEIFARDYMPALFYSKGWCYFNCFSCTINHFIIVSFLTTSIIYYTSQEAFKCTILSHYDALILPMESILHCERNECSIGKIHS